MFELHNSKMRHILCGALTVVIWATVMYSCASIGQPKGGPVDEAPPRFLKSTPELGALNNTKRRISIEFDEFIKLEKASEKVVVSPPQTQAPEIKPNGKKVTVNLLDSLKPNTTYTIDFSDAIVDNNEGNPLGNFTYTFSTGNVIDTMEVSGVLLESSNLEPIKGMLVGLQSNLADSAFQTLAFDRVARTDSRGKFSIRGVAPGSYHIFGLQDADQNFMFNQKSEAIAFHDSLIIPRFEMRTRMDTIWADTITVDTIMEKQYTHYLPDHIILRAFKEDAKSQYLVKNERITDTKFSLFFAAPTDSLPVIKGLNFDEKDAFIIEHSQKNDTLHYWIKDSLLYQRDTLEVSVTYLYTDTLGVLVPKTDTLNLTTKKLKGPVKKKKKDDEPEPMNFFKVNVNALSAMDVYRDILFEFEHPIAHWDSTGVHLLQKVDTLWHEVPFVFRKDSAKLRSYELLYDWEPEKEYQLKVDSTTFHSIYGLFTNTIDQKFKVRSLDEYGAIFFNIDGVDSIAFVELLDAQDKLVRSVPVIEGQADFLYLNPGKYYARLINDTNGNGAWDTGSYENKIQPETVYYYPQEVDLKAMWEATQDWYLKSMPLDRQKVESLKKQKPDEDKKRKK